MKHDVNNPCINNFSDKNEYQTSQPRLLSVVSPVYKAENCVVELCRRLETALSSFAPNHEIVLVVDGSPDASWEAVVREAQKNPAIRGLRLSRNFGQHNAITAGLKAAKGDWIVVMDCDLQDAPEEIEHLWREVNNGGFDVVFGRRAERKDSWSKRLSSRLFYAVYNYMTDSKFDRTVSNFSISRRPVIDALLRMNEQTRTFPLFVQWLGFKIGFCNVTHAARYEGKTSYTLAKLLRLASRSILAQSNKPLSMIVGLGTAVSAVFFLLAVYHFTKWALFGVSVSGWTTIVLSIWLLGGLILLTLGLLGIYIGRIFDETKRRPIYIIAETTGDGI